MSENQVNPEDKVQNSDLLKNIARRILITSPLTNQATETIDDLVDEIYEQHFSDIFPNAVKTESDIQIDLSHYESKTIQTPSKTQATDDDIWIFGYGSLIWKADFPFVLKQPGYIKGFERRFYQNSLDHRGTPSKPGRVVTLIPSTNSESKVWGMAYRISSNVKDDVLKHLDYREKNGYERFSVKFYKYSPIESSDNTENNNNNNDDNDENALDNIIVYVATKDNDSYVGHINNLDKIAEQIYSASGPSGTNREYVYKLANSMRMLFPDKNDDHLFELESKLRRKEEWELDMSKKVRLELIKKINEVINKNLPLENIQTLIIDLKNMIKDKSLSKQNSSTSINGINLIEDFCNITSRTKMRLIRDIIENSIKDLF